MSRHKDNNQGVHCLTSDQNEAFRKGSKILLPQVVSCEKDLELSLEERESSRSFGLMGRYFSANEKTITKRLEQKVAGKVKQGGTCKEVQDAHQDCIEPVDKQ